MKDTEVYLGDEEYDPFEDESEEEEEEELEEEPEEIDDDYEEIDEEPIEIEKPKEFHYYQQSLNNNETTKYSNDDKGGKIGRTALKLNGIISALCIISLIVSSYSFMSTMRVIAAIFNYVGSIMGIISMIRTGIKKDGGIKYGLLATFLSWIPLVIVSLGIALS